MVTYIANDGVLLKLGDKKILIDGLCKSDTPIYKSTPADICEQIILGTPPYDSIDLMLITHDHWDHFDAESIGRFLQRNFNMVVISTCEVISNIKSFVHNQKDSRLIALSPEFHQRERVCVNGVSVQAISMLHDDKEYADVKNLAYLIHKSFC